MQTKYSFSRCFGQWLRPLAVVGLVVGGGAARGQNLSYIPPNATNLAGTYTDLGATRTIISTANFDDANSAVQTIPFPFSYNGSTFTQFVLNTNGFIRLGAVAPVAPYFSNGAQDISGGQLDDPILDLNYNLLLPFNTDLQAGIGGTEYSMATTGAVGSRVCTIQWKNVSDKSRATSATNPTIIPSQYANISFQAKLYETTGQVDFVYGTATPSTNAAAANFIVTALTFTTTISSQLVGFVKPSGTTWAGAIPRGRLYLTQGNNGLNIRNTVLPDAGRTFRFRVTPNSDAAVTLVYAYDQLTVPAGQPVVIRALVTNTGRTVINNRTVNLTVTGANTASSTQTVATLAVGSAAGLVVGATAVVVFPAVSVPLTGINTVTVSLATPDDYAGNDSQSVQMVTNVTTTSFITPGIGSATSFGSSSQTIDLGFLAKVNYPQAATITAVNAYIDEATATTTIGHTLYGVVVDATTGAVLAQSANFVATAATVRQLHTFALTTPVTRTGDVLVGLVQVNTVGTGTQYFPLGAQLEEPTRPTTFYTLIMNTGATPVESGQGYKYMLEAVTAAATSGVSTLAPATGVAGTAVAISGSGFTGATAVRFNGVAAASFTVNSATSITAVVPAGATSGVVTVVAGTTYTSPSAFTVQQPAATTIAVDGYREVRYGTPIVTQTTPTSFGNAVNGDPATALGGSELDAGYSYVHGDSLYVFVAGNLESNGNRLEVFFDSQTGGQNQLTSVSTDVSTNGANNLVGLGFDTGFTADYYLSLDDVSGQLGAYFVPLATGVANVATTLTARTATLNLGSGRTGRLGINNSNTGGVNDATIGTNWAAGVVAGVELAIPLTALGSPTGSLKVAAFIGNATHDYLSNQVLGGLPSGTGNLTPASTVNFANYLGNQFFTVTLPSPTVTAITPTSGATGSTISLTGINLNGTTTITFSGTSGNTVTTGSR